MNGKSLDNLSIALKIFRQYSNNDLQKNSDQRSNLNFSNEKQNESEENSQFK